jgi:hypothetical protein
MEKRRWLRCEIIHQRGQGKGKMGLYIKRDLRKHSLLIGLRLTVDTALIPLCHTCFSKENQVHNYMHARIKFHAYSDIKVNTETVSRKERGRLLEFTLNPGNEGSKHHRQSTGGCVRLAPAHLHSSFLLLSNTVYSKGEHLSYSASVGKDMNAKAL